MSESLASHEVDPVVAEVESWLAALAEPSPVTGGAARLDRIAWLERLKAVASAAQARETVAFKQSRVEERKAAGVRAGDLTKGIGSEIALARQQSPYWGSRLVGLADALVNEMPHTFDALSKGEVSEYRASLLVVETACLSLEDRGEVDRQLNGRLAGMGDKRIRAEAKRIAYQLDPHAIVDRARKAEADRRVTSWPAPETMMNVCALLPVTQGAAVMAALTPAADTGRAAGDDRSRGQLMADTFVERLTGQTKADQTPVEIQLVMTDQTLLGDDHTPAWLGGYGPVPAPFARTLLRTLDDATKTWIRRIFTDPVTGAAAAVDTRKRLVTGALRRTVIIRDRWCRTPWCNAPIRHLDHVLPVQDGGQTTEANTQGLCEACNYAKQAAGWRARPGPGGAGASVQTTTPTGHTYVSRPPPMAVVPPGAETVEAPPATVIEIYLRNPLHVEYVA